MNKKLEKLAKWYKSRIGKFLPKNNLAKILDLPCGYGNFLYFLKKQGYKNIIGVDIDQNFVKYAKSIGVNAIVMDWISFLNDKRDCYDFISTLDYLEHLQKNEMMHYLDSSFNALKNGGRIVLRLPCSEGIFGARDRYNDITHEQGFTSGSITRVLKTIGFNEIIVLDEAPQPYKVINVLRLILYVFCTRLANLILRIIGIGAPKIWTTSMWVVAKK